MTASIYDLIKGQLAERSDEPLDGSDESMTSSLRVLREALAGGGSWEMLDRELRALPMVGLFDEVVPQLGDSPWTEEAKALFRTLAHRATNYEPAKWGIGLGYLNAAQNGELSAEDVDFLLDCARHPELITAASPILRIAATNDPDLELIHLRLLPLTTGWGVVELIRELERKPQLLADESAQRQVLIYGARNGAGLSMECYFDIARIVDFSSWIERARDDDEVFRAVVQIMNGLCTEREPRGGLADRTDAEELLAAFVDLLCGRPTSIDVLYAINNLELFFESTPDWPTRGKWEPELRHLYHDKRSPELLRDAFSNDEHAWKAGGIVRHYHEAELADAVADLHRRRPDYSSISTLGTIGRAEDQQLIAAPLEAVDWQKRRGHERLDSRIVGRIEPEENNVAWSLQILGHWPNDRSIRLIALAAEDFNPDWRSAAARGIQGWSGDGLPPQLRDAIEALLSDPARFVSSAAADAAAAQGVLTRSPSLQDRLRQRLRQKGRRS